MARYIAAGLLAAVWLALAPMAPAQSPEAPSDGPPTYTPPLPTTPTASPGLTAADVERIVDAAVSRALARRGPREEPTTYASPQAATVLPAAQSAPATGLVTLSASAAVATPQPVSVLVPPGPVRRGLAQFGAYLEDLAQPRVKTLRVAPIYAVPASVAPAPAASAVALPPLPSLQR